MPVHTELTGVSMSRSLQSPPLPQLENALVVFVLQHVHRPVASPAVPDTTVGVYFFLFQRLFSPAVAKYGPAVRRGTCAVN